MSRKHKETVQKQFAKTVEAFSKFAVRDTPEVLAEKVEFARPQPGELALDIACGPGAFVLALAPRVRFACGLDLTLEMLAQATQFRREREISNVRFDRGDAEQLPYPDEAFDLVSCQCSFHHLPKPQLVLREMVRVTKPEGRLMLIDSVAPEGDAKFDLYNRIEKRRDPSHAETLRLTSFLALFAEHDLEVTRQTLKRRPRSFRDWMRRAGLEPGERRFEETRKLLEESMPGDRAGLFAQAQGDDILIVHHEALFLLMRRSADNRP